jgi:hypothetical protein
MQEQNFNELREAVKSAVPETSQRKVDQIFTQLVDENKLLSLPEDEFNLLMRYRQWKVSADRVTGVFHHRPGLSKGLGEQTDEFER